MAKTIYTKAHRELVKRLIEARNKAGLKQGEVAKKLGRTQSYLSKLESGQRRLDIVQIKELASIYKKNPKHFIK
ncbi:MAG: helix-turn-helix transcriptional regulator [Candidatus Omnitrophota bacterium]